MKKYLILILVGSILLFGAGSAFALTEFHGAANWVNPPAFQGNPWVPRGEDALAWYVWEPLMYYVPASGEFIPCLATSMDVDTNAKTITAYLCKGAVWQDGVEFTSKDILATFYIGYLKHWDAWNYLESIEAPDDYTVIFHFKTLTPLCQIMLCKERIKSSEAIYGKWADQVPAIIARGGDEKLEADIYSDLCAYRPPMPIGTGPFKLKDVSADMMILDKFPNYWGADKIKVDMLKIYKWGTNEVMWSYMMAGVLDGSHSAAPRDVAEAVLKVNPNIKLYLPSDLGEFTLVFNCTKVPMSDVNFRKAVAFAIDADLLRKVSYYYSLSTGDYTTGVIKTARERWLSKDFLKTLTNYSYNPEKAEEILLKAGYKKGTDGYWKMPDGKVIKLEIMTHKGYSDWILGVENAITQLDKFGIKAEERIVPGEIYEETIRSRKFDIITEFGPKFHVYGSPWTSYNTVFGYKPGTKIGQTLKEGTGFPDVAEGINTAELTAKLGRTADFDEQKAIVEKLAYVTNEYLPYYSLYEKRMMLFLNDGTRVTGWPAEDDPIYSTCSGGIERMYKVLMQEGILQGVK